MFCSLRCLHSHGTSPGIVKQAAASWFTWGAGQPQKVHWDPAHDNTGTLAAPPTHVLLPLASCPKPYWRLAQQEGYQQGFHTSNHLQVSKTFRYPTPANPEQGALAVYKSVQGPCILASGRGSRTLNFVTSRLLLLSKFCMLVIPRIECPKGDCEKQRPLCQ